MDNYQTLLDKGEFELVIRLTEHDKSGPALISRVEALIYSNKIEEALKVIQENQKAMLKEDMAFTIKIHIQLLCNLERFDEAYEMEDYYQNLPYESQKVEEVLRKLRKDIRKMEIMSVKGKKSISDEEIRKYLSSKDDEDVLNGIEALRGRDVRYFIEQVKDILINYPSKMVRCGMLLTLVEKHHNEELSYNHLGDIILVNPAYLVPPFDENEIKEYSSIILKLCPKDVSLISVALSLISNYVIATYPDVIDKGDELFFKGMVSLAKKYYGQPMGDDEVVNKIALEIEEIIK